MEKEEEEEEMEEEFYSQLIANEEARGWGAVVWLTDTTGHWWSYTHGVKKKHSIGN